MSKNREVRELQFSSTQLIVLFMAILILGVFIFLLGVSVGKKQSKLSLEANLGKSARYQPVKRIVPTVPKEAMPGSIDKELASHAQQTTSGIQPGDKAKPQGGIAQQESAAKPAPVQDKTTVPVTQKPLTQTSLPKTGAVGAAPAQKTATRTETSITPPKQTTTAGKTPVQKQTPATRTQAKPVAVKKQAPPPVPVKGQYYVQLAAFEEKKEAEDYTIEIKAAGFPLIILNPLATDKKPWYRVRIGGYATKEDAEQAVARLKSMVNKKKLDYWITRD